MLRMRTFFQRKKGSKKGHVTKKSLQQKRKELKTRHENVIFAKVTLLRNATECHRKTKTKSHSHQWSCDAFIKQTQIPEYDTTAEVKSVKALVFLHQEMGHSVQKGNTFKIKCSFFFVFLQPVAYSAQYKLQWCKNVRNAWVMLFIYIKNLKNLHYVQQSDFQLTCLHQVKLHINIHTSKYYFKAICVVTVKQKPDMSYKQLQCGAINLPLKSAPVCLWYKLDSHCRGGQLWEALVCTR